MKLTSFFASSAVMCALAAGHDAAAQSLALRIQDGLVTIDAENVTVDEILARWTAATGLNVVSKNGVGSDIPVTLHLAAVPEPEALRTVLRDLSGYIMGERRDPRTGVTTIDRLLILPQSAALASAPATPAPRFAPGRRFTAAGTPASLPGTAVPSNTAGDAAAIELAPVPGRSSRASSGRLIGTGPGAVLDFTGGEPNVDPGLEEAPAPAPAAPPSPFGNSQGASRPGQMTPAPRPVVMPQIIESTSGGGAPSPGTMPLPPEKPVEPSARDLSSGAPEPEEP